MTFIEDPRDVASFLRNLFAGATVWAFRYSRTGFTLECDGRGPFAFTVWTEELEIVNSNLLVEWRDSCREAIGADGWRDDPAKAAALAAIVERPIISAVLEENLSLRLEFDGGHHLRAPSSAAPESEYPWTISVSSAGASWGTCTCEGQAIFLQRSLADHVTASLRS